MGNTLCMLVGVFCGLVFLKYQGLLVLGNKDNSLYEELIEECELNLPRTENCILIAIPENNLENEK